MERRAHQADSFRRSSHDESGHLLGEHDHSHQKDEEAEAFAQGAFGDASDEGGAEERAGDGGSSESLVDIICGITLLGRTAAAMVQTRR